MRKMWFLGVFFLIGSLGYAQTDDGGSQNGAEASEHGTVISELSKDATVTGKEKGALISSAARAKALTMANANARFIRGDAKPGNANENANTNATVKMNANANMNANAAANASTNVSVNGKPAMLPPVLPPTTGKPETTPVGKPAGVPVGTGSAHAGGN